MIAEHLYYYEQFDRSPLWNIELAYVKPLLYRILMKKLAFKCNAAVLFAR